MALEGSQLRESRWGSGSTAVGGRLSSAAAVVQAHVSRRVVVAVALAAALPAGGLVAWSVWEHGGAQRGTDWDEICDEDKARRAFNDIAQGRAVRLKDFTDTVRECDLGLTPFDAEVIFHDIDGRGDGDGDVDIVEWQRFSERWPSTLAAMAHRLRLRREYVSLNDRTVVMRKSRVPLLEEDDKAQKVLGGVTQECREAQRELDAKEAAVMKAQRQRQKTKEAADEAGRVADVSRRQYDDLRREHDVLAEKEHTQEAGMLFEPTMRKVQEANKTLAAATDRRDKLSADIARLERELAEAREKRDEAEADIATTQRELEAAEGVHAAWQRENVVSTAATAQRLRESERRKDESFRRQHTLTATADDASKATAAAAAARQGAQTRLTMCHARREPLLRSAEEQTRRVADHDRALAELEERTRRERERGRSFWPQENSVVMRELQFHTEKLRLGDEDSELRRQRDSVDGSKGALRQKRDTLQAQEEMLRQGPGAYASRIHGELTGDTERCAQRHATRSAIAATMAEALLHPVQQIRAAAGFLAGPAFCGIIIVLGLLTSRTGS